MCDSVNHTRFPKEDHVPDCAYRDRHGNKGDRVDRIAIYRAFHNVLRDYKHL
jgi:hypothetical protein